jgi:hypothetical protein
MMRHDLLYWAWDDRGLVYIAYIKHVWHVKYKINDIFDNGLNTADNLNSYVAYGGFCLTLWLLTMTDRRQTRPLVREGAKQRQHSNFQTENNIWSLVPEWTRHQDMTLTFFELFFKISQFICNLYTYIQIQSANFVLRSEGVWLSGKKGTN